MNKMKIKIFTLLSLLITFSLALSSCDSLWDDLNNITVSFDSNTGTGTMEPQIFEADVPQALNENKFIKNGYTFAGWATSANASTAEYADKANFTAKEDTTLYAIWKIIPAPVPSKYTITYVSDKGTAPESKIVEQGYKLTAEDLPDLGETDNMYFNNWDKTVGTKITANTTITAIWDDIVYLKNFKDISEISTDKAIIEKIVFTKDTYTGSSATIDCSDTAGYFTGVLSDGTASGQKILTVYGNGHRIYAPADCSQIFDGFSVLTNIEFNNFNTSKVTNMNKMFYCCKLLSSMDLSKFDTSSVTDLNNMFSACEVIESLNLSSFDTSSVTNMSSMFNNCKALTSLDVSNFDTSKVTDMSNMFKYCSTLTTLDLRNFDTTNVTLMNSIFEYCSSLTNIDISSFDTSNVTNMFGIFGYCDSLTTLDLSNFLTPNATNMGGMFASCTKLSSLNVSNFDTSKVTGFANMFNSCTSLTSLDLSSFDTTAVMNIGATMCWSMFANDGTATNPLIIKVSSKWTINESNGLSFLGGNIQLSPPPAPSRVTISYVSAYGTKPNNKEVDKGYKLTAEDLPNIETDTQYGEWDKTVGTEITADTTITANWEDIVYLKNFKGIMALALQKGSVEKTVFTEDTYTGDTKNTIDCSEDAHPGYFTGVISSDNKVFTIYGNGHRIYSPVDSSQLFSGFNELSSIEFNNFYTSKVTNMMAMLSCAELTSLDLSSFNTSNVTDMSAMFEYCEKLQTLDLSSFNTEKVTNMSNMFYNSPELTSLDVSTFVTTSVTDMNNMFSGCNALTSLDISKFDTSSVTNMEAMFQTCKNLTTLDLSSFDTSSVSNMKCMFEGCEKITVLDISSFDFSSMPDGKSFKDADADVFKNCSSLVTIYATNNFKSTLNSVFEGCSKLVGGAGTACNGTDNINASYARIDTDTTPGYFTLKQ